MVAPMVLAGAVLVRSVFGGILMGGAPIGVGGHDPHFSWEKGTGI